MKARWRIPWLVALAFGCSLVVTTIANFWTLQREIAIFTTAAKQTTLTHTMIVAQAIDRVVKQEDWEEVQTRLRRLNGQPIDASYQVIALDGRILADSRRIEAGGQRELALLPPALVGDTQMQIMSKTPYLIQVTTLLVDQYGQATAVLRNVTDWESQLSAMHRQALLSLLVTLLTAIVVTVITMMLLWRLVVGPLEVLRRLAEAVSQGELAARAPAFYVVELQQVGAAFNQMLVRNATQQAALEQTNRSLQATNTALQAQTETVQTINHIGRLLFAETDQQKLTQSVINATTELTGAEFGAFFYDMLNESGEHCPIYTLAGTPPNAISSVIMSSNTALLAHTFQGKGVIRIDDIYLDQRFGHHLPPGHVPVVSYLAAPIISRAGQIMGGLFFGHTKAGVFTERDEQIIVGLVAQIAVAMDNAHLFAAAQREISERKQAELRLNGSLAEKEALLKEIHHRVKNNLQVISSLLHLQSRQVTEPAILEIFRESQNRIRSMAIIHEKLYQAPDLARIDFAEYTYSLISYLFRAYGINADAVRLQIDIINIVLGLDTAIPCGLIINELVSNALKYAFAPDQAGTIYVGLAPTPSQQFCLTVRDNGRGLPPALDFRQTDSFGLQLVILLTEQMDGVVELDRNGGTTFRITFFLEA